jgi:hypothetical protein
MPDTQTQPFSNTTQGLLTDIENLLGKRLGQLQEEVLKELGKAATAGASVGSGLGMAALGTILGGLGFVHLLNKATGLPLWLCYGLGSAAACGTAAALVSEGVKKVGDMEMVPEGTGRRIREKVVGNGR